MLKIKRTSQLVARDVPYIMHPKQAIQTLRQRYGVSDHRDFASCHLHEQYRTHSIEFPYVRANDIEEGRIILLMSVAQHYAVNSKGTVRNFLPSTLEFKVRHLLGQPRKENIHQEQAYFAEVKALLEDQFPMPLEAAKVVEKPKAITESTSFVNKSPNTQTLKAAQASAHDYWEDMADSAVEEGGLLGFPKYLGSKTMGALADIGHGIGQSVDALVHNPEESVSGIAKGVANFGPEAFNLATDGVKTVADGYSLLSDSVLGTDTEGFRNSAPYKIDPIFELNEAEVGANLIAGLGAGMVTKLPKAGKAKDLTDTIPDADATPSNNALRQTGGGGFIDTADELYDAIRASDTDVGTIAIHTGIKPENIQKVKDHVFYNEHLLDKYVDYGIPAERARFESDLNQAQAWQRLEKGTYTDADIDWLKHEAAERWYEIRHNSGYTDAHNAAERKWTGNPWGEK
jgi:hypothetical protein